MVRHKERRRGFKNRRHGYTTNSDRMPESASATTFFRHALSRLHARLSLRTVLHELGILGVIVVAATLLKHFGFLYPIERFLIDLYAVTEPTVPAEHTALIDIDEESYKSAYF